MIRFLYVVKNRMSDEGFDRAVEVYELRRDGYPKFVVANYRMKAVSWAGAKAEAIMMVGKERGHAHNGRDFDCNTIRMGTL